jgi:hypothetical protein
MQRSGEMFSPSMYRPHIQGRHCMFCNGVAASCFRSRKVLSGRKEKPSRCRHVALFQQCCTELVFSHDANTTEPAVLDTRIQHIVQLAVQASGSAEEWQARRSYGCSHKPIEQVQMGTQNNRGGGTHRLPYSMCSRIASNGARTLLRSCQNLPAEGKAMRCFYNASLWSHHRGRCRHFCVLLHTLDFDVDGVGEFAPPPNHLPISVEDKRYRYK